MKNLLTGMLAVACVMLMIYSFVQRSEAELSHRLLEENKTKVQVLEQLVMQHKGYAELVKAEAEKQQIMAEEARANCAKKK